MRAKIDSQFLVVFKEIAILLLWPSSRYQPCFRSVFLSKAMDNFRALGQYCQATRRKYEPTRRTPKAVEGPAVVRRGQGYRGFLLFPSQNLYRRDRKPVDTHGRKT